MRYAALLFNTIDACEQWEGLSAEEAAAARAAEMPRWNALFAAVGDRWVDGKELGDRSDVRVVRVRDGETQISDGPFAETKEVLAGVFVVDCDDLDDAIELARLVPLVDRGAVELRPLVER